MATKRRHDEQLMEQMQSNQIRESGDPHYEDSSQNTENGPHSSSNIMSRRDLKGVLGANESSTNFESSLNSHNQGRYRQKPGGVIGQENSIEASSSQVSSVSNTK